MATKHTIAAITFFPLLATSMGTAQAAMNIREIQPWAVPVPPSATVCDMFGCHVLSMPAMPIPPVMPLPMPVSLPAPEVFTAMPELPAAPEIELEHKQVVEVTTKVNTRTGQVTSSIDRKDSLKGQETSHAGNRTIHRQFDREDSDYATLVKNTNVGFRPY